MRCLILSLVFLSSVSWLHGKNKLMEITPDHVKKIEAAVPSNIGVQLTEVKKCLVFSTCGGFVHASISAGEEMFRAMQRKYPQLQFTFEADPNKFTLEYLQEFDVFINNNATQVSKTFSKEIRKEFLAYIEAGGAFVGIHGASDPGNWPEYIAMIGGQFNGHPWTAKGTWDFEVVEPEHFCGACFQATKFSYRDEIYLHKNVASDMKVIVKLDLASPKNTIKKEGQVKTFSNVPVSWEKNYGLGKIFYSTFGHNSETFWNPEMVEHFLRGLVLVLKDL